MKSTPAAVAAHLAYGALLTFSHLSGSLLFNMLSFLWQFQQNDI